MPISTAQFTQMLERTSRNKSREVPGQFTPCEKEVGKGGLHEQIEMECMRRGWPIVHSRTDMRTTTLAGVPDFVIAASRGRTLWVECKAKGAKQTLGQKGFEILLTLNDHKYSLVYSFQEFLSIADNHASNSGTKQNENHMETKIK